MFNPIPFTKANNKLFNLNDIASRMEEWGGDCYTPTYPLNPAESSQYVSIAKYVTKKINEKYLPCGLNFTTLLRITHVHLYVKVEFDYKVQVTVTQTNCSNPPGKKVCVLQPYTPTVLSKAMVYTQLWFGTILSHTRSKQQVTF